MIRSCPHDTIMEAVHRGFYIQLDSTCDHPINMKSKSSENATNVFVFERASHGYIACLNQNPVEGVMIYESCAVQKSSTLRGVIFGPHSAPAGHPSLK